jgi:anthranilate synthase component 2
MALAHKTLPMWGVQFHPEAILTQYGLPLLKNWLSYCHL